MLLTKYNYGEFVGDCLRSVRAQTYEKFECLIVDDCSSDDTPAIVEALLREWQDARFRSIRLPRNVGQLGAQTHGFRETGGEFVVFVDADDLLFPHFVERHLFVHHNIETAVGFTSSNQWTITRDGQVLSKSHSDLVSRVYSDEGIDIDVTDNERKSAPASGILFPFWHAKKYPTWWVWGTQSTMMFRRPLLAVILPSSPLEAEGFRVCADFYTVRLGQLIGGSFVFREALGCYRRHGANNFSRNGLIAARMQTGDTRSHPSMLVFRDLALRVLGQHREEFIAIVGMERYYELVTHVRYSKHSRSRQAPIHRRIIRDALVRVLGEPTYVRLRLSIGRLFG